MKQRDAVIKQPNSFNGIRKGPPGFLERGSSPEWNAGRVGSLATPMMTFCHRWQVHQKRLPRPWWSRGFFGGMGGWNGAGVVGGKHVFGKESQRLQVRFLVNQKKKTQWKMKWTLWTIRSSYWKWVFRRLVCAMFDPEMFTYLIFFWKQALLDTIQIFSTANML